MRIALSLVLGLVFALPTSSFATDLVCKSAKYGILIRNIDSGMKVANYRIKDYWNDGAEVSVGHFYRSDKVLSLSLTVDGVEKKFEVTAVLKKPGKYNGKIFFDQKSEKVSCNLVEPILLND